MDRLLDDIARSFRRAIYIAPLLLATACTTTPTVQCLPLREYPPEFSQRLATELDAMPADSATVEAIGDYIAVRDQIRACHAR